MINKEFTATKWFAKSTNFCNWCFLNSPQVSILLQSINFQFKWKKSWNLKQGKLKTYLELTNKQVFNCQNKLWKSLSVSCEWDLISSKCCSCCRKWDLVAHHSKVNEEAKLMKKNVCFLLDANNQSEGRMDTYPKADPHPLKIRGQDFLYTERGSYMQRQISQLWQSSWNWSSVVWSASSWLFERWLIFSTNFRLSLLPLLWVHF